MCTLFTLFSDFRETYCSENEIRNWVTNEIRMLCWENHVDRRSESDYTARVSMMFYVWLITEITTYFYTRAFWMTFSLRKRSSIVNFLIPCNYWLLTIIYLKKISIQLKLFVFVHKIFYGNDSIYLYFQKKKFLYYQ